MSSTKERCYGKKIGVLGQNLKECPYIEIADREVEEKGKGITRMIGEKWMPRRDLGSWDSYIGRYLRVQWF